VLKVKVNGNSEWTIEPSGKKDASGTINGGVYTLDLLRIKPGSLHVLRNNRSYTVEILKTDPNAKSVLMLINGNKYQVELRDKYDELLNSLGMNLTARVVKEMKAPMPGMVLDILVKAGDEVSKDQPLIVLEAMKMENMLKSPADGKIKSISISKGNAVEKNQVLIHFE
jgi:biotin carboxyl carrier protein